MASLKEDIALATNLLGRDQAFCNLMDFTTKADKASRLVPGRQPPGSSWLSPVVSVWLRSDQNLLGPTTSNTLVADIYTPLTKQRETGVGYDIATRVREVLDRAKVGRGLEWVRTDPDRLTTTGFHKATVYFSLRSTTY